MAQSHCSGGCTRLAYVLAAPNEYTLLMFKLHPSTSPARPCTHSQSINLPIDQQPSHPAATATATAAAPAPTAVEAQSPDRHRAARRRYAPRRRPHACVLRRQTQQPASTTTPRPARSLACWLAGLLAGAHVYRLHLAVSGRVDAGVAGPGAARRVEVLHQPASQTSQTTSIEWAAQRCMIQRERQQRKGA